jgi:hypothetical protein
MEIIPALQQKDSNINTPICYYGSIEEGILIMENLKEQGFDIKDKRKGDSFINFNTQYCAISSLF